MKSLGKFLFSIVLCLMLLSQPVLAATGVTMSGFKQLQNGMTYSEVVEILGQEGEELSSGKIGDIETAIYTWKAGFLGANMNAMFQDNKLITKAQIGLKK